MTMWRSRTRNDLIIEVWEKLDCENVGRAEIEAIQTVVAEEYGRPAVDPPMMIARLLAEEGAELRHAEIMELHVERASDRPYDPVLRNLIDLQSLKAAAGTIRQLENLRRKYVSDANKEGLRKVLETARAAKQQALDHATEASDPAGDINTEITHWLTIWLQTPEIFDTWLDLRVRSADFFEKYGRFE